MAKGIVVVDDIPVICAECNFAHLTQNKQYFHCDAKIKQFITQNQIGVQCKRCLNEEQGI